MTYFHVGRLFLFMKKKKKFKKYRKQSQQPEKQAEKKKNESGLEVSDKAKIEVKARVDSEVLNHYQKADSELTTRITHKERGMDVYEKAFRNYINPAKWPFSARVPDGRAATLLKRKTDRLLANRLQGRMNPTKFGTELAARIATELILCQWNDVDLKSDTPMLMRWRKMDLNTRKFGASFGLCKWKKNNVFDGPWFEPLENRDVLTQPGVKSIEDSDWLQVRNFTTKEKLKKANDTAKSGPIYRPEAIAKLSEKDNKNYTSVNKDVLGLDTNEGNRIEIITEYRPDRWITFAPQQGSSLVLRDIPNPYNHRMIPVIRLVYDMIDDDIYGVPELEAVLPLIKAAWALMCQYLESAQSELYTPLHVNPNNVQLDTLEFKKGARWLMSNPGKDVVAHQTSNVGMQKFRETFAILTSLILDGMGESGQDISNIAQTFGDKTATEVKDMALLRSARDNANKLMLSSGISKMVYLWFRMDQQFLTGHKLVNITGKDSIKYLVEEGLHNWTLSDEGISLINEYAEENSVDFDAAYEELRVNGNLEGYAEPLHPVQAADGESLPKLKLENDGRSGFLAVTKDDIDGEFDFIPDVEAMSLPNDQSEIAARTMLADKLKDVEDKIEREGYRVKWKELMEKIGETAKLRDVEQFFEKMEQGEMPDQNQQIGSEENQVPPEIAAMTEEAGAAPINQPNI